MYYINDPQFYEHIIKKELPPFDFKIHVFLENGQPSEEHRNLITAKMREVLDLYGVKSIRDYYKTGGEKSDKLRYEF